MGAAPQVELREVQASTDVMTAVAEYALELAKPGDTVLLAPAAASMDQFKDYADRGKQFARAARKAQGIAETPGESDHG